MGLINKRRHQLPVPLKVMITRSTGRMNLEKGKKYKCFDSYEVNDVPYYSIVTDDGRYINIRHSDAIYGDSKPVQAVGGA